MYQHDIKICADRSKEQNLIHNCALQHFCYYSLLIKQILNFIKSLIIYILFHPTKWQDSYFEHYTVYLLTFDTKGEIIQSTF